MKKYFFLLITVVFAIGFLDSCSDNSSNPDPEKNLYPSKVGNFWIYERTGMVEGQQKTYMDSTVIIGTETKFAKVADIYKVFTEGNFLEEYYRYSDGSKLYALPSELLPADILALIPSEILPQNWVIIADNNSSDWSMFTFPVTNIPISLGGVEAVLNGEIQVTGTKGSTSVFTVKSQSITAQEFTTKIAYVGTVAYSGINAPLNFSVSTKSYFADKVGLVKSETPKQDIAITFMGQNIPLYTIEASSRMLHHYSVIE